MTILAILSKLNLIYKEISFQSDMYYSSTNNNTDIKYNAFDLDKFTNKIFCL